MRTRVAVRRADGSTTPLVLVADGSATAGDVAEALVRADPSLDPASGPSVDGPDAAPRGARTLAVAAPAGGAARVLAPAVALADDPVPPGCDVRVVAVPSRGAHRRTGTAASPAAVVRVVAGPDAGLVVEVPRGVSTLGRDPGCDVVLTDPRVAPLHARLRVDGRTELVDAGAPDGIVVAGGRVPRVVLGGADLAVVGDSVLRVETDAAAGAGAAPAAVVRSPRVVPALPPVVLDAPAPPEPGTPSRFPLVGVLAPLVLGAALLAVTRSPVTLLLVGLSPLLALGAWWDRRTTDRRRDRAALAAFRASLAALVGDVGRHQGDEVRIRRLEHPTTAEALVAAARRDPLLWSRRPDGADALVVRLGDGQGASRVEVRTPSRGAATAEAWQELAAAVAGLRTVGPVPVLADLRACGSLGVAEPAGRDAARALVARLVALAAPADLVVAAVLSSSSAPGWAWAAWLPHTADAGSPLAGSHLASSPAAAADLVARVEEVVASRRGGPHRGPGGRGAGGGTAGGGSRPALLVVVEDDAPADRGALVRLAEEGPAVGVHVLWCASGVPALPSACRTFLAVGGAAPDDDEPPGGVADAGGPGGTAAAGVRVGRCAAVVGDAGAGTWTPVEAETLTAASATALARDLCGVTDAGAAARDDSDLPRSVPLLALTGPEVAQDAAAVVARWRATGSRVGGRGASGRRRVDGTLRAVVGQGVDGPFVLDRRTQGPHALVGGTTGSGKSEFLQAWVLALAAAHGPDRVTFLLVDYKGGAAFADCVDLPHTVGLVTDLSGHLVRRALASLRAELRHRERLLARKGAKDLLALERTGDPDTPPALVIVVDEFAALVREVPEFVEGVLDVAQRGRSLGLHLVLATQRPAGVVTDAVRANTSLRVALRMADEHDSVDVLGVPVAAHVDPALPGRGAVRTGPGRVAVFQTGWAGGRSDGRRGTTVALETLGPDPAVPWGAPASGSGGVAAHGPSGTADAPDDESGPTDARRVVATVAAAAALAAVPPPRRPWLPELPAVLATDLAPGRPSAELPLGLLDVPAEQARRPLVWRPDREGALVVLGAGGSGRTTALRTVALAAATSVDPVHVHVLDLTGGGLRGLEALPAVGSVVEAADHERVARLLTGLTALLDERAAAAADGRSGGLEALRRRSGATDLPRVLLLVDGVAALREGLETDPVRAPLWTAFARVLTEGRPLGVHVAMTAERPSALPTALAGAVGPRVVLRQADDAALLALGVPRDVLRADAPPGRGVLAGPGHELQLAAPGGTADPAAQAAAVDAAAAAL
ncbi:FtsK/SpoIIIE domain-containing protein, partial [Cellulomonas endophytica]|uniref:FtsK/SpoIIIE domain-containing protein n=1 Tax=Cellulomonas endophytica TaxID=2494735 RepID=UPI001011EDF1